MKKQSKTIIEIYNDYQIMPMLQVHMLRVAAVAKSICDHHKISLDTENIVSACLIHDMGNIIKFKLDYFPEAVKPEGLEYWTKVQKEFMEKWGDEQHRATNKIAEEIGISSKTRQYLDRIGFSMSCENRNFNEIGLKIGPYADMRVSPEGVKPLQERLEDLFNRYQYSSNMQHVPSDTTQKSECLHAMERQIFVENSLSPEKITDELIAPVIEELQKYHIV